MCLFKKKENIKIESKYKINETVSFRYRNDLRTGIITKIYLNSDKEIVYDIQFGGECPAFLKGIKENNLVKIH